MEEEQREGQSNRELMARLVAPLSLLLLVLALHGGAVDGWWLTDDPQVLLQAVSNSPFAILFSPHVYRALSSSSFTPLVTLSFQVDYAVGGVQPSVFYTHQLMSVALCAILIYFLLETFIPPTAAWFSAALFLVLPATTLAVRTLMIRHYVEGLAFSLAALLLWCRRTDSPRRRLAADAGAAAFYLLAMLAKEFWAPVALLFIAQARLAGQSTTRVSRRIVPSVVAAGLYLYWRGAMLGSVGGYGGAPALGQLRLLPLRIWQSVVGIEPWDLPLDFAAPGRGRLLLAAAIVVSVGAAVLLATAAALRPRAALYLSFASAVVIALPLLALAGEYDSRYAFPASAFAAVFVGLAIGALDHERSWAWPVAAVILVAAAFAGLAQVPAHRRHTQQMRAEGEYVWERPVTAPTLLAWSPGWYLEGLARVRESVEATAAPRFVLSTTPLLLDDPPPESVVTSHEESSAITPLDSSTVGLLHIEAKRYRRDAPLALWFERHGNDLAWSVAPAGADFTLLSVPAYDDFPMPPAGWRRLPEARETQYFRIRRQTPDGQWTLSPVLPLPSSGQVLKWGRGATAPPPPEGAD